MSIAVSVTSGVFPGLRPARSLFAAAVFTLAAMPALAVDETGVATPGVATSGVATSNIAATDAATSSIAASNVVATDAIAPHAAAGNAASGPAPAAANTAGAAVTPGAGAHVMPAPGAAVTTTSPLNMMLGLLFLLGLIASAWWFVKRAGGAQWQSSRAMKVVTSLPVGARERVMLIEVGGRQLLVGVAPGRVNLLHHFDEPVLTDTGSGEDFASRIRQVMQHGLNR